MHADLIGKIEDRSSGGAHYVLTILDDCTRYSAAVCLSSKATAAQAIIDVLRQWERQTGKKTKAVRTDGGAEFMAELDRFFATEGIVHQRSVRYTPQQNGRAERLNRTLLEKTRSMLFAADLPKKFWAEAITTANYLQNVVMSRAVKASPFELFFGRKPDVSMLRVLGSLAHVHVPKEKRGKFDKKIIAGVFVGYEPVSKGWRVLHQNGNTWRSVVSRDVMFDEGSIGVRTASPQNMQKISHGMLYEF